jgi:hypothetical protein
MECGFRDVTPAISIERACLSARAEMARRRRGGAAKAAMSVRSAAFHSGAFLSKGAHCLSVLPRPAILGRFKLHRRLAMALGRGPQMRNKAPKGRTTAPETVSRLVTRGFVCTQTPGIQEATCEPRDTLLRVASHAGLSHVSDVPETPPHKTGGRNLDAISRLKRRGVRFPTAVQHGRIERIGFLFRKSCACPAKRSASIIRWQHPQAKSTLTPILL